MEKRKRIHLLPNTEGYPIPDAWEYSLPLNHIKDPVLIEMGFDSLNSDSAREILKNLFTGASEQLSFFREKLLALKPASVITYSGEAWLTLHSHSTPVTSLFVPLGEKPIVDPNLDETDELLWFVGGICNGILLGGRFLRHEKQRRLTDEECPKTPEWIGAKILYDAGSTSHVCYHSDLGFGWWLGDCLEVKPYCASLKHFLEDFWNNFEEFIGGIDYYSQLYYRKRDL